MQEEWSQWKPLDNLHRKYTIDLITDSPEKGFTVHMSSVSEAASQSEHTIRISFQDSAYAYRYADEGSRLKLIYDLSKRYGDTFYGDWTFFTVKNSSYIKWISEESLGVWDELPLIHYALLCDDPVLDILSRYEPIVTYAD